MKYEVEALKEEEIETMFSTILTLLPLQAYYEEKLFLQIVDWVFCKVVRNRLLERI